MSARGWAVAAILGIGLVCGPLLWAPVVGQLDWLLMKLGLLAFGGGFTLIPLIQADVVTRLGWLTTREFIDGIALGQVTPGPIVITATPGSLWKCGTMCSTMIRFRICGWMWTRKRCKRSRMKPAENIIARTTRSDSGKSTIVQWCWKLKISAKPSTAPTGRLKRTSANFNDNGQEEDGNALHRRSSDPRWPRVMPLATREGAAKR